MKRIVIALGILVMVIAATILRAQQAEGVITYEVRINMHRNLPKERENMKAMTPEFRTSKQRSSDLITLSGLLIGVQLLPSSAPG